MRAKKYLSMLLVVVMMLSLFPVNAFALGGGSDIGIGGGFGRDIGDDEVRDFDPSNLIEDAEEPVDLFSGVDTENGIQVTVESRNNALPTMAEVRVTPVDPESVREAVAAVVDGQPNVLVAMDISFWLDGIEIEPEEPVNVKISAPELTDRADLTVVHIPDAEDAQPEAVELVTEDELSFGIGTNEIAFKANSFSVYVVVGDDDTSDEARVTVNFWNNTTKVATVYVKNSDVLLNGGERQETVQYIEDIVYDPGVGGTLPSGQLFKGWSPDVTGLTNKPEGTFVGNAYTSETTGLNIEDIQRMLDSFVITEGDELNVYAMVFNVFDVTYEDDKGVTIASDYALCSVSETKTSYTVSQTYSAVDDSHNFEGWHVKEGASNISNAKLNGETAADPYKQGTTMDLTGNVVFSTVISTGNWLVFVENGKGATYNAPVFVKSGQKASDVRPDRSLPENMERTGYEFVGWFLSDPAPTNPGADPNGVEFDFDQELNDKVTVYAKWKVAASANYTVVVWKQKVSGGNTVNDYDFSEAHTLSGEPNTAVTAVARGGGSVTDANGTYQNVNVKDWKEITGSDYLGFHAARFDGEGDAADVIISPNGNTVVNVYYDRNMVQLNFNVYGPSYTYTKIAYTSITYGGNTYYVPNSSGGYDEVRLRYRSGTVERRISSGNWQAYTGDLNEIYTRSGGSNSWHVDQTFEGLYGSTLAPTYTWPSNRDWYAGYEWSDYYYSYVGTGVRTTFLDAFIPASTSMIVNYYGFSNSGSYTIHFLQQNANLNGYTEMNTVSAGNQYGINFNLSDKYTGFKCVSYSTNGTSYTDVGELMNQGGNLYYDADPNQSGYQSVQTDGDLWIRFDRLTYQIKYSDGTYKDYKDDKVLEDEIPVSQGFGTSGDITYGASIADYGDPSKSVYNKPSKAGFYFGGWYADSTCTIPYTFSTMPLGGVQVYAKWVQVGYRVFLHPNAGTDSSLDWGSDDQKMNFSVGYDGTISIPTGIRTGYEFLGWFTGSGSAYNADTKLNDTTVPSSPAYNKNVDMTDEMDKWGNIKDPDNASNSDVNRPWIERKLDLYAKWSQVIYGAQGIGVIYDANGGSNPPTDTRLYKDNVDAIAQAASTAPTGVDPAQKFLYWVVQKWDGSKFVDLEGDENHVYPGETFTVLMANAKITDNNNGGAVITLDQVTKDGSYTYNVQLRAEYGVKDTPTPTHINWYSNVQTITGAELKMGEFGKPESAIEVPGKGWMITQTKLQINQAVDIERADTYTYHGTKFLGWARLEEDETGADATEAKLFLKWDETQNKFFAKKDESGEWTEDNMFEATQIACDEKQPYHDLYAVWDTSYFYIMHSATGELEPVPMTEISADGKYDLTAKVPEGYLYGGYYEKYGGVSAENLEKAKTAIEAAATKLATAVEDAVVYTGDKAYVKGLTKWFVTAKTAAGNELIPTAGTVYNLKEVPEKYLTSRIQYVYNWKDDYKISQIYLMTVVDDKMYNPVGLELTIGDSTSAKVAELAGSFSFVQANTEVTTTTNVTDFANVQRGFLGYVDGGFELENGYVKPNTVFTITPYWVTPDGVKVTGASRTFTTGAEGTKQTIAEVTAP